MRQGYLSRYFDGVAVKRLNAVETDPDRSNQHEFNGAASLTALLGEPTEKMRLEAKFLYLDDADDKKLASRGFVTWYDARRRARLARGVNRWEYHLYYSTD